MQKPKLFLMMTDLDGTIAPANMEQIKNLTDTLKEIADKKNITVKFCPISGRTSGYVLSVMDFYDHIFNQSGGKVSIGYGGAELGSIILTGKDNPFGRVYLYPEEQSKRMHQMRKEIMKSVYLQHFNMDPDAHFVTAFVLKPNIYRSLSEEQRLHLYQDLRNYLEERYKRDFDVVYSGCIEVKPREISKDKAIRWLLEEYQKTYDVKGMVYCGDSENDKKAIEYMARLAMVPGIKTHVFTPANAMKEIHSEQVEGWKDKFEKFGLRKSIKISKYRVAEGIVDLLQQHLKNGELINESSAPALTKDDSHIRYSM